MLQMVKHEMTIQNDQSKLIMGNIQSVGTRELLLEDLLDKPLLEDVLDKLLHEDLPDEPVIEKQWSVVFIKLEWMEEMEGCT